MKTIISLLLLACLTPQAQAQIQWQHCYGGTANDQCNAIRPTFDSGYILAGYATSDNDDVSGNHGGEDFWVVKISATGAIEWQKCYGGSGDDEARDIRQTADSGYIVAGTTLSNDGDVSGNQGGGDMWVIKISATGVLQWQKCLGGSGDDVANGVGQTNDGGYIVAGFTASDDGDVSGNHGEGDEWVVKLTGTSSIVWAKCYGGSSSEAAYSVQQTFDGGYIIGGCSLSDDGDVTGHLGDTLNSNFWVVKLADTGSIEWQESLGSDPLTSASTGQYGGVTVQTNDSGYVVVGQTWVGGGEVTGYNEGSAPWYGGDGWVVKITNSGAIQWNTCVYISGGDYINAIQQTADKGYIIAGQEFPYSGGINGIFGKLTNNGSITWVDTFGPGTAFTSCALTGDGTGIAAGYATGNVGDVSGNQGVFNYWVVKFGLPNGVANIERINTFIIAPNPANQYINITASGNIASIAINNMLGQQVFSGKYDTEKVMIDVSTLPAGMYFVETNGIEAGKFVKE